MKPKVAVLFTDGINREYETSFAFESAGADTELVHLNALFSGEKHLRDYQMIAFPGGFSFGDDVLSAKILANTLLHRLRLQIEDFISRDTLVIGICNGFQALVRIGVLPFREIGNMNSSLIFNDSGKFESRFVRLRIEESNCIFTKGMEGQILDVPVSHGEGKFIATDEVLQKLEDKKQVVFRYVNSNGHTTEVYPANPNGSLNAIAGITDPSGKILGLMPHPECHVKKNQHPNWTFPEYEQVLNTSQMFKNAVAYFA